MSGGGDGDGDGLDEVAAMDAAWAVTDAEKAAFVDKMRVTDEDIVRILNVPQRTQEWLDARDGRATGSNFGSMHGTHPYSSPKNLVREMLWKKFKGNAATEWGSKMEEVALAAYVREMRARHGILDLAGFESAAASGKTFWVETPGLVVNKEHPWLGTSPDGIVHDDHVVGLLEIKCPFAKKVYPKMPPYYLDQVQGIMGLMKLPWCDFVVWTPTEMQITRIPFDEHYWTTDLFPALRAFYFDLYLPMRIRRDRGLLAPGRIERCLMVAADGSVTFGAGPPARDAGPPREAEVPHNFGVPVEE
jgi:hypothetical protein